MRSRPFAIGDWVLYRKPKYGAIPGRGASRISPSSQGEHYSYFVEKFWVVAEVLGDGRLQLRTRRGKALTVDASDPNLRRAAWWQRWAHRGRFRAVEANISADAPLPKTRSDFTPWRFT